MRAKDRKLDEPLLKVKDLPAVLAIERRDPERWFVEGHVKCMTSNTKDRSVPRAHQSAYDSGWQAVVAFMAAQ